MSNITDKEIEKLAIKAYGNDFVRGEGYIAGYKQRLWEEAASDTATPESKDKWLNEARGRQVEEDLIDKIIWNWGNALCPIEEMCKWLKEYASTINNLPIELFDLAFESWANKQNWQLHSSNEYYYRSKNNSWPPDKTIEIADLKKQFMEYISIVNERNDNIPADFKQVTGHNSPKEMMAYEKGREDAQQIIIEWIEKWDGSNNSVMGALLKKKFNELFTYLSKQTNSHKLKNKTEW